MSIFRHSGDLGDIIYFLSVAKGIGGKHSIYLVDRHNVSPFTNLMTPRAGLIIPLITAQPYMQNAACLEDEPDVDMCPFRMFHSTTTTLVAAQATYYNMVTSSLCKETGETPWLETGSNPKPSGRVLVARSPRYNNPFFPWPEIVEYYGDRVQFVGSDQEYSTFCNAFGNVDRLIVTDFLQLSIHIQNCSLFIGNQSSPMSIAVGLGQRIIQEVCLHQPDCIFKRENAKYVSDGECILPPLDTGKEPKPMPKRLPDIQLEHIPRNIVPPGMWQYPGLPSASHYQVQLDMVIQMIKCTREEADKKLIMHNMEIAPEYFRNYQNDPKKLVDMALEKAYSHKPKQAA